MSDTYTDRIDIAGKAVWLPPMPTAYAATGLGMLIVSDLPDDADWITTAQHLTTYGWRLIWDPFTDAFTLTPGPETWASARCAEARAGRGFGAGEG